MASKFELNTLSEIAVLHVAVDRILRHLAKNSNAINQLHHRALASLRRLLAQEVAS